MSIELKITEALAQMPDSLKQSVLHYAQFLAATHSQTVSNAGLSATGQLQTANDGLILPTLPDRNTLTDVELEKKYGCGSLAGKIMLSDDFDAPIENLKDYM
ncbi:MAG: DUF2281 domain-containing protein [Cyanobacteria bacterium P01_A01_bin.17]